MKMHEDFETTADLYVAGALAPEERRAVEAHVAECGPCAETLGQARAFSQWLLGTLEPDGPPADLEDRILERLEEAYRSKRKIPVAPILKTLGSLAAAGLLITLGFLFTGAELRTEDAVAIGGGPHVVMGAPPADSDATASPPAAGVDTPRESNRPRDREDAPSPPVRIAEKANATSGQAAEEPLARRQIEREKSFGAKDAAALRNQEQQNPSVHQSEPPRADSRKIIRNATLHLEVESYDGAYARLSEIAQEEKGFVAGADTERLPNGKMRAKVTVRVPPERFEAALARLRELGTVRSQSITTQDVTKAYLDLEARLASKQALVERLKKVLAEAQGTVKELMEVEVQMGRTIEEIEAIKGELKYYDNLVGLSTIVLELAEKDLGQPFEYVQTLQARLEIVARDPDAAYGRAQEIVTEAGGQVVDSRMTRQADSSTQGVVQARVEADKFPAVRQALRGLGHVKADTVNQQKVARGGRDGAVRADAPVRREQASVEILIAAPPVFVSRRAELTLESAGVEGSYQAVRRAFEQAGGQILEGSLTGQTTGASASLRAHVDAERFAAVFEELKKAGAVKAAATSLEVPPADPSGEPPLVRDRAEIEVSITAPPEILPEGHGLGRTIRDTVSGSVRGLLWSIEKLFVGASLVAPWAALGLGGWFLYRRLRRARAAAGARD